jgi:protein ImuA
MLGATGQTLDTLRLKIAALETHPAFAGAELVLPAGPLATPRGAVHEIFADSLVDAGAALGFALAQARGFVGEARPGLLILQLLSDTQETGVPYAPGLGSFGLDPDQVVLIRADTITELLWVVEEAIACRAIGAVVSDFAYAHKALDFTASRRLALRAAASEGTVFLVRYGTGREASAARYRWHVEPRASRPPPFDGKAPGQPRWAVTLERGSLGHRRRVGPEGETFLLDWTKNGFAIADSNSGDRAGAQGVAALSRSLPAALGDRLPETG